MTSVVDSADFEIIHQFPDGATEDAWRRLLTRVELPSHYVAPEFFLEPFWDDKRPFAVLAREAGELTGVLTGIHQQNHVLSGLGVRPQVCVDRSADVARTTRALGEGLIAEAEGAELVTLHAWNWTPVDALADLGFARRETLGSMVLDLSAGSDALFKSFDQARRRNIRTAMKKGIEISRATSREDILAYYEVRKRWEKTPRKVITLRADLDLIEKAQSLKQNHCLFLAKVSGKVIAGAGLRFFPGGLLEYAGGASMDEYLNLKPNDLLQWRVIEWACAEGFRRYSLGGRHPFLSRFGGELVPVIRYRRDRSWFRRHDLQEKVRDFASGCLHNLPAPAQTLLRRCFGR